METYNGLNIYSCIIAAGAPRPGGPEGAMAHPVIETRRKIGNLVFCPN